jgi:hypothetical protein
VVIDGDASLIGEILAVRITGLSGITLHGEVEERVPQRAARFDLPVLAG